MDDLVRQLQSFAPFASKKPTKDGRKRNRDSQASSRSGNKAQRVASSGKMQEDAPLVPATAQRKQVRATRAKQADGVGAMPVDAMQVDQVDTGSVAPRTRRVARKQGAVRQATVATRRTRAQAQAQLHIVPDPNGMGEEHVHGFMPYVPTPPHHILPYRGLHKSADEETKAVYEKMVDVLTTYRQLDQSPHIGPFHEYIHHLQSKLQHKGNVLEPKDVKNLNSENYKFVYESLQRIFDGRGYDDEKYTDFVHELAKKVDQLRTIRDHTKDDDQRHNAVKLVADLGLYVEEIRSIYPKLSGIYQNAQKLYGTPKKETSKVLQRSLNDLERLIGDFHNLLKV